MLDRNRWVVERAGAPGGRRARPFTGRGVISIAAALLAFAALSSAALVPGLALAAAPAAPAAGSAAATVDALQDALIDAMKHGKTCGARRTRLAPVVTTSFDFDFVASRLLRRRWSAMSPAQRTRFVDATRAAAIVTYAAQLEGYAGQHFEFDAAAGDPRRVAARLVQSDGSAVAFDYALRQADDGWKIVNVVAQGVSDLAVRSAQYEAAAARDGVDGLLDELDRRNRDADEACRSNS